MTKYSCSVCSEKTQSDSLYCEICKSWSHYKCQGIGDDDLNQLKKSTMGYICVQCRTTDEGSVDFLMGIERLMQAASKGIKRLTNAALREEVFLRKDKVTVEPHNDFSRHRQDATANAILARYHPSEKSALQSTGDGDCLFNSVSTLLNGDESRSVELRYRCCVEMIVNKKKILRHRLYNSMTIFSPSYDQDCLNCAMPGSFSSVWMVISLSNLLNIPINSVYPAVNGSENLYFRTLNTTFKPPFSDPEKGHLTIMWTSTVPPVSSTWTRRPRKTQEWYPNHFVPLVDLKQTSRIRLPTDNPKDQLPSIPTSNPGKPSEDADESNQGFATRNRFESLTEEEVTDSTSAAQTKTNKRKAPVKHVNTERKTKTARKQKPQENKAAEIQTDVSQRETPKKLVKLDSGKKEDNTPMKLDQSPLFNLSRIEEESFVLDESMRDEVEDQEPVINSPVSIPNEGDVDTDCDDAINEQRDLEDDTDTESGNESETKTEDSDTNTQSESDEETFPTGPLRNKHLSTDAVLELMKGPHVKLPEIPTGKKENTYFVIENSSNIHKRSNGHHSIFWDDCGAWSKASTPMSNYLVKDGQLSSIVEKGGLYCVEKWRNKERTFIPLEPQPEKEEVLKVHRLYQTLVASSGPHPYKRRITWLEDTHPRLPEIPSDIAVIEYIGTFPPRKQYGGVKYPEKNVVFIRTKPSVTEKIKKDLKHLPPKGVEKKLNSETDDDLGKQRNYKQVKNFKYAVDKETRPDSAPMKNIADHKVCVENMTQNHEFVRAVQHVKDSTPSVILYTDQQIVDIKRFCAREGGTVLGLDKTFNLGEFHVTPTVFKNTSIIRRTSQEHPIWFGPTLIHNSSTTKTYSYFLHHICDHLTDTELSHLVIGSDDELSLKSAIKRSCVGSTHVLCTRHLRQNTNDYLESKVGLPKKDRNNICEMLFGENGLTESTDIDTYTSRAANIRQVAAEKDQSVTGKSFSNYLESRLLPLLLKHVVEPSIAGKIDAHWTNNNCESANHILKSATKWKQSAMPDFIKTLFDIVRSERNEMCRAIRGMGNYKLTDKFAHHYVDIDTWGAMSKEVKDKRESKFLNERGRPSGNQCVSTDGTRVIPFTPNAGKKKGQRKRKLSERTRTPVSKRRLE